MATLITTHGGEARVAPSMREVPLESNTAAAAFADALVRGEFDVVVLLTGVGTRVLLDVVERTRGAATPSWRHWAGCSGGAGDPSRWPFCASWASRPGWRPQSPTPGESCWRRSMPAGLTPHSAAAASPCRRTASNVDLLAGLEARGARVTAVPVYQWALPEDLGPLEEACRALATEQVDVALFTTATGSCTCCKWQSAWARPTPGARGAGAVVIASIGPTTSDELRAHGIDVDMEPSHPKMGLPW